MTAIKKDLAKRIINGEVIRTRKYHYVFLSSDGTIRRIPLSCLGTSMAYDASCWETVKF